MSEELRARFEVLTESIRTAIDEVEANGIARIGDLDKQVAALCAEVKKANTDVVLSLKAPMAEMISRLDELARSLNEYQTRMKSTH